MVATPACVAAREHAPRRRFRSRSGQGPAARPWLGWTPARSLAGARKSIDRRPLDCSVSSHGKSGVSIRERAV